MIVSTLAALAAAACFATSSVVQHRATSAALAASGAAPSTGGRAAGRPSARLLGAAVAVLRRPAWLAGAAAGLVGCGLQAIALATGALVVVQLLLVSGLLMALPAGLVLERRVPRRREGAWAVAAVAGQVLFLVASRPRPGVEVAPAGAVGLGAAAAAVVVAACALAARWARRRWRAALLGLAAGAAFGVGSALLKQVLGELGHRSGAGHGALLSWPVGPPALWPALALVVAGAAGAALAQASYASGALAAAQPALTLAEPLVASVLGASAFAEGLDRAPLAVLGQLAAVLLMASGVVGLAVCADPDRDPGRTGAPVPHPRTPAAPAARRQEQQCPPPGPSPAPRPGTPGGGAVARAAAPRWSARPRTAPRAAGAGTAARRPRVLIVSGSVGAGHDGAAAELASRLRAAGVDTDVRDHLAALPTRLDLLLRQGYTLSVGRVPAFFEWLYGAIERRAPVRAAVTALCRSAGPAVLSWTREHDYSLIVSTYPLASQTLGDLRRRGLLDVPVVTYLTDPSVHRCWVHPGVDHHWTVTAATADHGLARYGVAMRPVGPLVPERFARPRPARRAALRGELGVGEADRLALVVTGSLGLGDAVGTAAALRAAGAVPLVLCGRNRSLRARLAAVPGAIALGWRGDVDELMAAADVLVHNAGGLSFTEALVAGLPAVSYRCIPGHGLANAAVLEEAGLAAWARREDDLAAALAGAVRRGRPPVHDDPSRHVLALLRAGARADPREGAAPAPAASPVRARVDAGR